MFPLEGVSVVELQELCETLWKWDICPGCKQDGSCTNRAICLWSRRSHQFDHFFDFYRSTTSSYLPDSPFQNSCALSAHKELLHIIRYLQEHQDKTREQITDMFFTAKECSEGPGPSRTDQHRAVSLAVRVLTTINNKAESLPGALLESGSRSPPSVWRNDKSLTNYIDFTFPRRHLHPVVEEDIDPGNGLRLTAVALKKVAGLRIEGTDDISHHLRVDPRGGLIEIFHHVAVLNEQLEATKYRGAIDTLPTELVRETLDTLVMLFPPDRESTTLLRTLISKKGFDPLMRHISTISTQNSARWDARVNYSYWNSRLLDLRDEIENPKPRGLLVAWLEQRSKARHVMIATIAGVVAAVVLGILSLAVSIFQAWLTYQQWKGSS
ncbi:hypothetical protein GQ53DRAFT_650458 [Thozetella sp. PMI_491]|nr:hypothetical protein GQ53DRAFT_650458 [Thozetella sp. PMI_491]